jgi:hypothetical protein
MILAAKHHIAGLLLSALSLHVEAATIEYGAVLNATAIRGLESSGQIIDVVFRWGTPGQAIGEGWMTIRDAFLAGQIATDVQTLLTEQVVPSAGPATWDSFYVPYLNLMSGPAYDVYGSHRVPDLSSLVW